MSELGKSSPQHRSGLDAGGTDSVDLTPENHGPHRMNGKQTANVDKTAYKVPQLLFLTHQNLSNSYPNTATVAWLRMPYTAYGMLTPFSEYNENTIRKLPNAQNSSIQSNAEFPRKHCRKCQWCTLANRFEIHSFYACFSHFTVGSSKTRQITIRGLVLNTTNHDTRTIGLTEHFTI